MANTQRPPPPVMHDGVEFDDLGALEEVIEAPVPKPSAPPPPPPTPRVSKPATPIARGGEEDVLDLSALAKLGSSLSPPTPKSARPPTPPPPARARASVPVPSSPPAASTSVAPRLSLPDDWHSQSDPVVLPRRQPAWLMPLLVGLGVGAAVSAVLFATTSHKTSETQRAAQAAPSASPAPAPVVAEANPVTAAPTPVAPAAPAPEAPTPVAAAPVAIAGAAPAAPASSAASPSNPPAPAVATALAEHPTLTAAVAPRASNATNFGAYPAPPGTRSAPSPDPYATRPSAVPYVPSAPSPAPAAPPAPSAASAPSAGPVMVLRPASEADTAPAAPAPASAPVAAAAKPSATSGLDSLLDNALSPDARRAEQAHAAQASAPSPQSLPFSPSRDDVARSMDAMLLRIKACAMGKAGVATAMLSIKNDGHVATVQVQGAPFAGTPSGRCMEGVLRNAQFPRFREPTFSVRYPFSID